MVEFALCKKGNTPEEVEDWKYTMIQMMLEDGFELPVVIDLTLDPNVRAIGLCFRCDESKYVQFIMNTNLVIDQTMGGIHFLKSV